MAFLKTILIILLVYYALKMMMQLAKPYLMTYIKKKAEEGFEQRFGTNPFHDLKSQNEGEVTIDKAPLKNKKSNNTIGDYVDFEEID